MTFTTFILLYLLIGSWYERWVLSICFDHLSRLGNLVCTVFWAPILVSAIVYNIFVGSKWGIKWLFESEKKNG